MHRHSSKAKKQHFRFLSRLLQSNTVLLSRKISSRWILTNRENTCLTVSRDHVYILKRHVNFRTCDWLPSMCACMRIIIATKEWNGHKYDHSERRRSGIRESVILPSLLDNRIQLLYAVCSIYIYITTYVAKREKVGKIAKDKWRPVTVN